MSMLDQLVDMGFAEERAKRALTETGEESIEAAITWLMEHEEAEAPPAGEPERAVAGVESTATETVKEPASEPASEARVRSYKCEDCGKIFANESALEFHAVKSGHTNFAESTEEIVPLSEEERKQRADDLMARIKASRAAKQKAEEAEAIEKEKKRRIEGQKMRETKEHQKDQELLKIAADRKREKDEDKAARARILEQIRLDKEARKAQQEGRPIPEPSGPKHVAPPPPKVNYSEAKLQIRLADGKVVTNTFSADETLAAVRLWVELNHVPDFSKNFNFFFPPERKIFTGEDYEAPLSALKLVPSAAIVARAI